MNGAQDFIQSYAVLHRGDKFDEIFACVSADHRGTENFIFTGYCEHFDKPMGIAVGYGAVKVINAVGRQLIGNVFRGGFFFRQPDRGDFWIRESDTRYDSVISLKGFKRREECIDCGIPCLMCSYVCKLIGARNIADAVNVGEVSAHELVVFNRAT